MLLGLKLDPARLSQLDDEHEHDHSSDYDTWSFESDAPLSRARIETFATHLPEGIIRAKGMLYLKEAPEQRFVFQLVGKRWSLKPAGDWAGREPRSQVVMIGLPGSIDAAWLQQKIVNTG
jgi:G3E family GTPase